MKEIGRLQRFELTSVGERAGHVLSQVMAGDSGGRFDLPDVNGIGGRVQGSGYDH